jgi:hypothetical protein
LSQVKTIKKSSFASSKLQKAGYRKFLTLVRNLAKPALSYQTTNPGLTLLNPFNRIKTMKLNIFGNVTGFIGVKDLNNPILIIARSPFSTKSDRYPTQSQQRGYSIPSIGAKP